MDLETKFCLCGCGLTYRGLPGKAAGYFSLTHNPAGSGGSVAPQAVVRRGRGRRKKAVAYTPENGGDDAADAPVAMDDDAGDVLDLRAIGVE